MHPFTYLQGATASLSNDMIQSIVMQVKSMLPDENDSFLQACIVHYNGDSQNVINNILEDNIPPFLQEMRHVGQTATGLEQRTSGKRDIKNRASLSIDGNDGWLAGNYGYVLCIWEYLMSDICLYSVEPVSSFRMHIIVIEGPCLWNSDPDLSNIPIYRVEFS